MDIMMQSIGQIVPYDKNPRKNDDAVKYVAESIKQFGFKVPIVIDKESIIVAGHTRYKAAIMLGLKEVPCIIADDLTDEQVKAYRLADNKVAEYAEWDIDLLDAELEEILDIDMDLFGFDELIESIEHDGFDEPKQENGKLTDEFIVPPLSVFDTKQGYWQDRKRAWKALGIKSELGRDAECLQSGIGEKYGRKQQTGVSIFDPVLCEISYKWFCPDGGSIFDCFAGGSVRGIVASKLGYDYTGIDLRQEQVDANYKNAAEIGVQVKWHCDDSLNADAYTQDDSIDMIFSCPPYADLEVYSDDPRDISNMEYDKFIETYKRIIEKALQKLKDDRFAVFVVGDVRDKKGFYRDFISDTKQIFINAGAKLYNEIILLDTLGTSMIRCKRPFNTARKVAKVHQNVLVFYKGDPKNIKRNYTEINVEDILNDLN